MEQNCNAGRQYEEMNFFLFSYTGPKSLVLSAIPWIQDRNWARSKCFMKGSPKSRKLPCTGKSTGLYFRKGIFRVLCTKWQRIVVVLSEIPTDLAAKGQMAGLSKFTIFFWGKMLSFSLSCDANWWASLKVHCWSSKCFSWSLDCIEFHSQSPLQTLGIKLALPQHLRGGLIFYFRWGLPSTWNWWSEFVGKCGFHKHFTNSQVKAKNKKTPQKEVALLIERHFVKFTCL